MGFLWATFHLSKERHPWTGSSATVHHPYFILSQPRSKRCKTHQYIACNIYSHQQLTKTNEMWPTSTSSVSPHGTKPYNLKFISPQHNWVIENPLQVSFSGGNLISKGPSSTFPVQSGKENSSEAVNFKGMAQRKKLVFQPASPSVSASNLQVWYFSLNHTSND